MADRPNCTSCGAVLPAEAPQGLCPKCLLKAGFAALPAAEGLHVQCPHCHNPIELVDEQKPFSEVECPSCGSSFSLLGSETQTYISEGPTSVGRFELQEQIGIGAFGTVWKARDPELDRTVAVKIPRKDRLQPTEIEQFLREARSTAQLKHPHIVSVHEVGRDGETIFIVSDFIDGVTLADWTSAKQPPLQESVELCAQIAEALHHAHEAGVIHRDLKPSNIMLDATGQPHIMDFGLAKREAGEITMTVEGKVLGTPAYMSPEQAQGEAHKADRRSDVYSLGVILFELMTGEKPFRGTTRMLLHQVIHDEPPSPRRLNANVPRDMETICLKCLEKEEAGRYATAHEVAIELRRFLRGEPIHARRIGSVSRGWRWMRRHPTKAGLLALAVFAMISLMGVAVGFVYHRRLQIAYEQLDQAAYLHRVSLAYSERKQGENAHAMRLLQDCPPSRRDWEWYYISRLFPLILEGHNGPVNSVAFSAGGRRIVSASDDGTLRIWSTAQGTELLRITAGASGQNDRVQNSTFTCASFSPDGGWIASGNTDGTVSVWNAASGEEAFSFDGHESDVLCLAFRPDGGAIATGGRDGALRVWEVQSRMEVFALMPAAVDGSVTGVAYNFDGSRIACCDDTGRISAWDTSSGMIISSMSGARQYNTIAFYPDGERIVAGGYGGEVQSWDVLSGRLTAVVRHRSRSVTSVSASPAQPAFASGSNDGSVRIWETNSVNGDRSLPISPTGTQPPAAVNSVAYSPRGDAIAIGTSDGIVSVWPTHGSRVLAGHESHVEDAVCSPDSRWVLSASLDGTVRIWDIESGEEFDRLSGDDFAHPDVRFTSVAISADGRWIVAGGDAGIFIWHADTRQIRACYTGETFSVVRLAFSADGESVIGGSGDGFTKVWDVQSGEELLRSAGKCMDVGQNGRWIEGDSLARTIRVWNVLTAELAITVREPNDNVTCAAVSGNEQLIVCGRSDGTLVVWDTENGNEVTSLEGHRSVLCVAFSPNDLRIVSGDMDGGIRVWHVPTGEVLLTLRGHVAPVSSVVFSPDGRRIVSSSEDRIIRVWDTGRLFESESEEE